MATSFELIPAHASVPAPVEMRDVLTFIAESLAPATRRAYRIGLADFTPFVVRSIVSMKNTTSRKVMSIMGVRFGFASS